MPFDVSSSTTLSTSSTPSRLGSPSTCRRALARGRRGTRCPPRTGTAGCRLNRCPLRGRACPRRTPWLYLSRRPRPPRLPCTCSSPSEPPLTPCSKPTLGRLSVPVALAVPYDHLCHHRLL